MRLIKAHEGQLFRHHNFAPTMSSCLRDLLAGEADLERWHAGMLWVPELAHACDCIFLPALCY